LRGLRILTIGRNSGLKVPRQVIWKRRPNTTENRRLGPWNRPHAPRAWKYAYRMDSESHAPRAFTMRLGYANFHTHMRLEHLAYAPCMQDCEAQPIFPCWVNPALLAQTQVETVGTKGVSQVTYWVLTITRY